MKQQRIGGIFCWCWYRFGGWEENLFFHVLPLFLREVLSWTIRKADFNHLFPVMFLVCRNAFLRQAMSGKQYVWRAFYLDLTVLGLQLDSMILKVFSKWNYSMLQILAFHCNGSAVAYDHFSSSPTLWTRHSTSCSWLDSGQVSQYSGVRWLASWHEEKCKTAGLCLTFFSRSTIFSLALLSNHKFVRISLSLGLSSLAEFSQHVPKLWVMKRSDRCTV